MKTMLRLEELAMLAVSIFVFDHLHFSWGWFFGLFLAPDIGLIGYLFSNKAGAFIYNLFHHKGMAILLYGIGIYTGNDVLQLAGVIMFAHSSFDRMLGYGLKYQEGFKFTHLGIIGK